VNSREQTMVPEAEARSYYGRAIVKEPVWNVPDVPGYLFLGGLAGASASMAAVAQLTGHHELVRVGRIAAAAGALAGAGALVHDLGRPDRFLNMLRVLKVSSPLSVGSWILAPFSGLALLSAATDLGGRLTRLGGLAGAAAGVLGPGMCTYTAVLLADTAVPAWHEAHPELAVIFAGSAMSSAAGAALVATTPDAAWPARRIGLLGAVAEFSATSAMERRLGGLAEPYHTGRAGTLLKAAKALSVAGAGLSLLGKRSRIASVLAGAAYLAAGACTKFGIYYGGTESTKDPKYVVLSQTTR
jgi:hypothetical protein